MSDILPVSMQDFLHSRKPELRKQQIRKTDKQRRFFAAYYKLAECKKKMVHQYKNNGFNMVLDTNSGAVHVVDETVYRVIGLLNEGRSPE